MDTGERFPYASECYDNVDISRLVACDKLPPVSLVELIAYFTSDKVMDYDGMSDFFLTFRLFTDAQTVLDLLCARLAWAIRFRSDTSEVGRDITVRTFVMLRHWILNFFVDDFLANFALRQRLASAINAFCALPEVQTSGLCTKIFQQLKRCWISELSGYWDMGLDAVLNITAPLSAGGVYGNADITSQEAIGRRRLTLLSFYDGPVAPIMEPDPQNTRSLIKGGVLLDQDVSVPVIKVVQHQEPRHHRTPMRLLRKLRFDDLRLGHKQKPKSRPQEPLQDIVMHGKFDVLCLRGLEELGTLLEERVAEARTAGMQSTRQDFTCTPNDTRIAPLDNSILESSLMESLSLSVREPVVDTSAGISSRDPTADTLDVDQFHLINESSEFTQDDFIQDDFTSTDSYGDMSSLQTDMSHASFVASHDVPINLRRSATANGLYSGGILDALDIDQASYHGSFSSLSTLSRMSFTSANDEDSCASTPTPSIAARLYSQPDGSGHLRSLEASRRGRSSTSDISLLSELSSGYEMAPCRGFNSRVAAELAAIPDESFEGNALEIATRKLEGTYRTNAAVMDSASFTTSSEVYHKFARGGSRLYSQAFASRTNIHDLAKDNNIIALGIPSISATPDQQSVSSPVIQGQHTPKANQLHENSSNLKMPQQLVMNEHVPFVLGFTSDVLCDQFTAIERDALNQVDWKELVEVKWAQVQKPVDSWLEFLTAERPRGVSLVTSRFNLVVNWIKSEILLCRQVTLKAQAITRFIHLAQMCKARQNFATMFQIVLALSSETISQHQTTAWSLVSGSDVEILSRLEKLVSPLKNFSNLRRVHKRIDLSKGCIPFTGIYLTDLAHNQQKPNMVDNNVNFPKFQVAACVLRSYLQCIEWSKNYTLEVNTNLLSKCLYLNALTSTEMENLVHI